MVLSSGESVLSCRAHGRDPTRARDQVSRGGVTAVDDVSLEIGDGEFIVLVGPSGCGKSTLLRMIAGLEEVTDGAIAIGGADVTELAPRRRDIAMVFQNYALYPHMTVRQNLGYGLKVRRTPKDEIARRVDEVAKLLGLEELLDRRPAQLSGGQRQRVAMGRAIVREPKAFLMDEPLSNLDAKLRVGMRASLAQLHARLGVTTVYVTHDQVEAMTLGQRVAVMRDGRSSRSTRRRRSTDEPREPLRRRVHRLAGDEPRRGDGRGRRGRLRRLPRSARPGAAARRPRRQRRARHPARGFEDDAFAPPGLPRLDVDVEVLEELGSDAHVFFLVDAPRVTARRSSGSDEATLLLESRRRFSPRASTRARAPASATRSRLARRPGALPLLRPGTAQPAAAAPRPPSAPLAGRRSSAVTKQSRDAGAGARPDRAASASARRSRPSAS